MTKFINILKSKLTIGNVLSIIASFLFAILIKQLYLYFLDFSPVRGELEALDISYLGVVIFFRFIFSMFLEYLLEDKYSIPLFEGIGNKEATTLSMVNSDNNSSSDKPVKSSSSDKPVKSSSGQSSLKDEDYNRVKQAIERRKNTDPSFRKAIEENDKFIQESSKIDEKMYNVVCDQEDKIFKLQTLKRVNDIKFIQENGDLELSVPSNMTDSEAAKLSKQVGALDRGLQNKFSEYENLSRKEAIYHDSNWVSPNKAISDNNKEMYRELFDEGNDK